MLPTLWLAWFDMDTSTAIAKQHLCTPKINPDAKAQDMVAPRNNITNTTIAL